MEHRELIPNLYPTMKTLLSLLLLSTATCGVLAQQNLSNATLSDRSRGIAQIADELTTQPGVVASRYYSTIESSSTEAAPDLQERLPQGAKSNEVVEVPQRALYKLLPTGFGSEVTIRDASSIVWHRDFAERIRKSSFGRTYSNPRQVVRGNSLAKGNLVTFTGTSKAGRDQELTSLVVLPPGAIDEIKQAMEWRAAQPLLFAATAAEDKDAIAVLRQSLVSPNPYQRLASIARLRDLAKLVAGDVEAAVFAARSTEEVAATALLTIRRAPELADILVAAATGTQAGRITSDGVALGAAIHFFDLPDSDKLLRRLQAIQFTESPSKDEHLEQTVSYPVLHKLGQQASPTIKQSSLVLQQMLTAIGDASK